MAQQDDVCPPDSKQPYMTWKVAGMEFKFGGKEVISILMLLALGGPIIYGLFLHDAKVDNRLASVERALNESAESQDATNYILTLSQEERQKLNLSKPKRIREMERR